MITIKKQQNIQELKLDGYKHIMKNDWGLPDNLVKYLKDNNFYNIADGNFSSVYRSNTEDFIIKINGFGISGFKDNSFNEWYDYCRKNKKKKHLPKMGNIKTIKGENGKEFQIIFIEKLAPAPSQYKNYYDRTIYPWIKTFWSNNILDEDEMLRTLKENDIDLDFLGSQAKTFLGTLCDLRESFSDVKFDLHYDNIMMRANTFVINDPFFN